MPGVEPNQKDRQGQTPLVYAAKGGHPTTVKLLLATPGLEPDLPDRQGQTPLLYAAKGGHEIVRLLLDTARVDCNAKGSLQMIPLHRAVEGGHISTVKLLLATPGINLHPYDYEDLTPLSYAAALDDKSIFRLLLTKSDVDYNTINHLDDTLRQAANNDVEALSAPRVSI